MEANLIPMAAPVTGERRMPGGDVIDFFWEWYRRRDRVRSVPLCQYALDKCEETFIGRDWEGFGYWHAVFARERQRQLDHHVNARRCGRAE
jgi:hypothetical protein